MRWIFHRVVKDAIDCTRHTQVYICGLFWFVAQQKLEIDVLSRKNLKMFVSNVFFFAGSSLSSLRRWTITSFWHALCMHKKNQDGWSTVAINTQTPRFLCLPEENMILQRKFIHSFFISHRTLNAQNYRESKDFKKFTKVYLWPSLEKHTLTIIR